jgi:germination protein M
MEVSRMKKVKMYAISFGLIMVMILGTVAFAGCGEEEEQVPQEPKEPKTTSYTVNLYYANDEYVETGDESLPKFLVEQKTIEISKDENLYLSLLKSLSNVPKDGMSTMITENVHFNDVYISEEDRETIVVDVSSEGLSGGSLGESLFIGQIVETLLNNETLSEMGEVVPTKVQFLVDGEVAESLMGHIDAMEPFTKSQ